MNAPIEVVVRRGAVVESQHLVHAVALQGGKVVEVSGDPQLVTFMRSSAKPIQALPLARAREDLDTRDLAIASASHLADAAQLAAVRALLAKAPAREDELECGPVGDPPRALNHNCSGKHAGMLALCRAHGWRSEGYRIEAHRCQRELLREVARAAEVDHDSIPTAVDGCGVVTFALELSAMAHAFARIERIEGGERVAAAMRAHPELIRGAGAPDTTLMQERPAWIAKGGAEGLMCAARSDGLALALKVADGNGRAVGPALAAFLDQLGEPVPSLASTPVESSRGERVGEIVAG